MKPNKLEAGSTFPEISVNDLEGGSVDIGKPTGDTDWKMVVVYRGQHCPICTKYLNQLEAHKQELADIGVELVAVSADSQSQLEGYQEKIDVSYPLYYGLSIEQMQELGLYISHPRSEQETDHPFPEPGLFVINENNQVHVVDIANNPFVRPDLEHLISGLKWIKNPDNNYPIRGTYK
ncbi:MAG: peroxiredoxin-like family protein [Gammaproteobacteria bacterium]